MASLTQIVVEIEAAGVDGVLTALKQVEGAQTNVVKSATAASTAQTNANNSTLQSLGAVASKVIGVTSLVTGFMKVGEFVGSTVDDWTKYADSMRLSAQTAGITVEEMSKMVQAADDFRVPVEKMQSAMEMALKNGFVPTINNLAILSDQLLATEDPAERAAKAADIFGKSYADMMPLLLAGSGAIRDATSAVSDNLVVTKDSAEQAKEYRDQLDALGDAWQGLKNNAGKVFLPLFISIVTTMTNALDTGDGGRAQADALFKIQEAYATGSIEKEQYLQLTRDLYNGFIDEASAVTTVDNAVTEHNKTMSVANDANGELVMKLFNSTNSWDEFSEAARKSGVYLGMLDEETYNAEKGITSLTSVTDDWTNANYEMGYSASDTAGRIIQVGDSMQKTLDDIEAVTTAYEKQKKVLEEGLTNAQINLNMSITTFREGVADSLVKGLTDAGLKGEEMIERLQLIDQYAGTNYTTQYKMELAIPDLLKTLIENPGAFADSMASFDGVFLPLQQGVIESQALVTELQGQLDALEKTYQVTVDIIVNGGLPKLPGDKWSFQTGTGATAQAVGGPVYPGQTYAWNESGREGELLIPSQYGRVLSNREVSQVIRDAELMQRSTMTSQNVNNSTSKVVNYNIGSPQYKSEPVLTMSEHLRILSTLESMS